MDNINENVELIMFKWKLKAPDFVVFFDDLGVSTGSINNYKKGHAKPTVPFLLRLSDITGISLHRLWYKKIEESELPTSPLENHTYTIGKSEKTEVVEVGEYGKDKVLELQAKALDLYEENRQLRKELDNCQNSK